MESEQKPDSLLRNLPIVFVVTFLAVFVGVFRVEPTARQNERAANSSALTQGPLEVLSPNKNERWTFGSEQEIKWQGGVPASSINVYLTSENGQQLYRTLLSETQNDGTEKWIVDVPPREYKIQIQSCPGCATGSGWDSSNGSFTVVADEKASIPLPPRFPANESLVVFSPISGEAFYRTETMDIRWFGGYETWQLKITLIPVALSSATPSHVAAEGVLNDGKFEWSIPTTIKAGDYYLKLECSNCADNAFKASAHSFSYITIRSSY
ncbi:MAG: hypothetical protein A2750_03550 [Candidatus Yanofskybacteria bacterium RIFCSPHIGHO2_01_FULL_45_42]|uniref:Yeast cell wall synthesis Kre9/Knh1-like N-terminal domain-containing protein n=3 Tax=Candidatus Yanofskyibacteriota TaxID=1752733 RepID=A0A1F8F081_9BACT|nr:MAG: hypothetical protein A2750_03550 [Candidatus Yanofskybacteria bacterium RIFCSPHIGHO2_01_FULL_45_42]OGN16146.1 MAG: hypothetical protein A3C81_01040 [Candidatus Yanofskybacteria bacterium RIFCSPHIGHO2_02_FULL_46_19]OGN26234.1 MAG: hypothetical protein A3B17_02620 [Candidatus Yanofskybacteria bacterium RIFCSPLOWO2_01_FULL_45_72]OGN31800.1 MAG: hypothetical protein A3J01_03355 [Candidatus Yanofskybacteria bacterium RIFCSPLOWO2_02_FULL_45_18]